MKVKTNVKSGSIPSVGTSGGGTGTIVCKNAPTAYGQCPPPQTGH